MSGDDLDTLIAGVDPDRYVAALFAPQARRRALVALYAFDHEVGRIAEIAHEPMVGHIRLAWWREQIAAIYAGAGVLAPVPQALSEAIRSHDLPRALFDGYLDARGSDFEEAPFEDEAAVRRGALAVSGGIMALAARVLGAEDRADTAAGHAATAVAYAGHLRMLRHQAERRRCRLPVSWLAEAGLSVEDVFAGRSTPPLGAVTARLAAAGLRALAEMNGQRFPTRAMPALAVAALARPLLTRARSGGDPFQSRHAPPTWRRVARIALANLTWRV